MIGLPLILLHNNTVNGEGFGAVAGVCVLRLRIPSLTLPSRSAVDHLDFYHSRGLHRVFDHPRQEVDVRICAVRVSF